MPRKTDTQDRIYQYPQEYIAAHGYAPSMQEISDAVGIAVSNVYWALHRMEAKGLISMEPYIPRSITLKGGKMRNLEAFNAMSLEGQRNALIDYFSGTAMSDEYDIVPVVDRFLDWLYSQAE